MPTSTSTPLPFPTATEPVPPTIVAAAPGDQFQAELNHHYELPLGWTEVRTDSSVVFYDRTKKVSVSVSEELVERWRYTTVGALGALRSPVQPDGWTSWYQVSKDWPEPFDRYQFIYRGVKHGIDYINVVQWFLWGEIQVTVSAEIPVSDWEEQTNLYDDLQEVLESFKPHDDSTFFTEGEVLELLSARLDLRKSGIYARDEEARARVELSCRQIFTDLLQRPIYLGGGIWQATAPHLLGTEFWQVYEPTGDIRAELSNQSVC